MKRNKKKTPFQKFLDRHGMNENSESSQDTFPTPGMSDEVRVSNTISFYEQYVEDLQECGEFAGMRIFSGNSEHGECKITEQGGFYCQATGLVANPVEFLLASEDLLTEDGAKSRYFYSMMLAVDSSEGDHLVLDRDYLTTRIESFRFNSSINIKLESYGLVKEDAIKYPFWFDGHNRFFYIHLTRLGYPVCKHEWRFDGDLYEEETYGVPILIDSPDADRIYFVENPMQLVSMTELVSDPVYLRPTTGGCVNNDFSRLIKGKQVVCMKAKNLRNANATKLGLTELQSNDINELLYFYEQDLLKKEMLSGGFVNEIFSNAYSDVMDVATASIEFYLKEKGIRP